MYKLKLVYKLKNGAPRAQKGGRRFAEVIIEKITDIEMVDLRNNSNCNWEENGRN